MEQAPLVFNSIQFLLFSWFSFIFDELYVIKKHTALSYVLTLELRGNAQISKCIFIYI